MELGNYATPFNTYSSILDNVAVLKKNAPNVHFLLLFSVIYFIVDSAHDVGLSALNQLETTVMLDLF